MDENKGQPSLMVFGGLALVILIAIMVLTVS